MYKNYAQDDGKSSDLIGESGGVDCCPDIAILRCYKVKRPAFESVCRWLIGHRSLMGCLQVTVCSRSVSALQVEHYWFDLRCNTYRLLLNIRGMLDPDYRSMSMSSVAFKARSGVIEENTQNELYQLSERHQNMTVDISGNEPCAWAVMHSNIVYTPQYSIPARFPSSFIYAMVSALVQGLLLFYILMRTL